jgi:hypothetical protein
MPSSSTYCYVLDGDVGIVSDLSGNVTNVICSEFFRPTHTCWKKRHELGGGIIKGTLAKLLDQATGSRVNFCEFTGPPE